MPPSLEILRTVERELETILRLASEDQVRRAVARLNDQIRKANFAITWGPPSTLNLLDVEQIVGKWRNGRNHRGD